jgi:hypothetical protein
MIRKLRQRHYLIWVILAIILPILFALSIIFRHSEPVNPSVPKRIKTTVNNE